MAGSAPLERRRSSLTYGDPFAVEESEKRADRRLRGRLVSPVTVWTSYLPDRSSPDKADRIPVGLTVSSVMLAEGEPPLLVGLLDSLSSLYEALCETRRCAVQVLVSGDERTASLFAGSYPGDPFDELDWADGTHGPRLARRRNGADCELIEASDAGYRSLVRLQIAAVSLAGSDESPLALYRGQFRSLAR